MAGAMSYKDAQRIADQTRKWRYPKFDGTIFSDAYLTYTDGSMYKITPGGLVKIKDRDDRKEQKTK